MLLVVLNSDWPPFLMTQEMSALSIVQCVSEDAQGSLFGRNLITPVLRLYQWVKLQVKCSGNALKTLGGMRSRVWSFLHATKRNSLSSKLLIPKETVYPR